MRKLALTIMAGALFAAACAPKTGIEVRDAWARTAAQGENGAVYFVIHNYESAGDTLTGASSDVAETVEIHESAMTGDVMEMQMVHSISLPSGEDVEFAPGGYHVMLFNLQRELKIGETIQVTLHFQNTADISVTAQVKAGPEDDD